MINKLPKILIILFCSIFVFQILSILLVPVPSQAVTFKPQVEIPDSEFKKGGEVPITPKSIGEYIKAIYKYAIGIVGILATIVLMFGGIIWITAGGNAERVGNAKAWIGAALTGLVLALTSYLILNTINPSLVTFEPIIAEQTEEAVKGCCEFYYEGNAVQSAEMMTDKECNKKDKINFDPNKKPSSDGTECVI